MARLLDAIAEAWWIIPIGAGLTAVLEVLGPTGVLFGTTTDIDPVVVLLAVMVVMQSFRLHRAEVKSE